MANKKISQLEAIPNLVGNEDLLIASNNTNYRIKTRRLADALGSSLINKAALGLNNVDNTSDLNKPVSSAMQLALNAKSDTVHTHLITSIDTLQTTLDDLANTADKANTVHSHTVGDVTNLTQALLDKANVADLPSKADIGHSHAIVDVTGLEAALLDKASVSLVASKADIGHTHPEADITGLTAALADKANLADVALKSDMIHTHITADVTGLDASLAAKSDEVHIHPLSEIVGAQDLITSLETQFGGVEQIPNVKGPGLIYIGDNGSYLITNYDSFTVYTITTTNGTINRTDDTFIYTPDSAGAGGFTINGKDFTITILNKVVNTPTITSPANNATEISVNTVFTSDVFTTSPAAQDTHVDSDWELASDAIFSSIIQSSYNDAVNKTSWSVSGLIQNTTYYVRVKYRGTVLTSDWSSVISFTTVVSTIPVNEQFIITAPDKAVSDQLAVGVSLSGDGTRIVIGAHLADSNGISNAGKAYIFLKTGLTWTQEAILTSSNQSIDAGFGLSVSMDYNGDRVVIGEYSSDIDSYTSAGRAYVFLRTGTSWAQEAALNAQDYASVNNTSPQFFGFSVAINYSGNYIVVGAYYYNQGEGKAYVFDRAGTTWSQQANLYSNDYAENADNRFGQVVQISELGDRVVISAFYGLSGGITNAGKVYIYSRNSNIWTQEAILSASDKVTNDQFGIGITTNAACDRIAIGARLKDTLTTLEHGVVYIFTRSGTTWTEESVIHASDEDTNLNFGVSLSMNGVGDALVIGSKGPMAGVEAESGQVYYFSLENSVWVQKAIVRGSDTLTGDAFSWGNRSIHLSADGLTLAVGAYLATSGGLSQAGKAYIYG